jgi:DNA polymerase III subunit alpha
MPEFNHLHCHTQFSLLDGAASIPKMIAKAKEDNMKAVAITDHGNMFGAFKFVAEAKKQGVKPIVGCEFYVVKDRFIRSFTGGKRDKRYHQLVLAKNQKGYENLSKLCSLGFTDGLYGKYPRIDKALIKEYSEGLIGTTCCIGAEVPQTILREGEEAAEKVFREWLEIFGDDYYIELQRHHLENIDGTGLSQEDLNQILLKWSKKYDVPVIATNDSHYVEEDDSNAHDILLCINTGLTQNIPIGNGRDFRFGFPNDQFFFKTQKEMGQLFKDVPFALDNTQMLVDSITSPELTRDVLLPNFVMPPEFKTQDDYLKHITYIGAKRRYGEVSEEIRERLDFELATIKNTGYPGYFLIVQDFTTAAREMGVSVGPGRGSAAGSAVAYCIGITNVDPIKYDLLFERFLNPDRVSLPDIDIDFDDEGRGKVIDYVVEKYGMNNVAQIITYGSMAAKSSIRDVARVLDLPLSQSDRLAKMVPAVPGISLQNVLIKDLKGVSSSIKPEELEAVKELRKIYEKGEKDFEGKVLRQAVMLEGSVRNTGVHACGVIITPEDITKFIPVTVSKDSDLLLTQFDNSVVEDAGLLKMDFLGLRTLSIIKDAIELIEENHGVKIDPDEIPLDDEATYKLFQKGRTNGVFQFESSGMQKYLKDLLPTRFGDLIAMNALFRPGPLKYIPEFVDRKHGRKEIVYDHDDMAEYLEETYGITVYQEQVMLLSQKIGGFTKGQADGLRKAMGKKKRKLIDEMKPVFMEGAAERGYDSVVMEKVWADWEEFAAYAFNKSHSTCYALIAFHTAYLKTHYPAEYMSAVLTHNMNDIKKVSFFMDECKGLGINVLGPDVNESKLGFSVNSEGSIRFGMAAVKGVGESAAEELIANRKEEGHYGSLFDLTQRVNLRTVNKKSLESLALAGAFDGLSEINRSTYIEKPSIDGMTGLELAIRYGANFQANKNAAQTSLFGSGTGVELEEPQYPAIEPWSLLERLNREKQMIGMYVSGHPLDDFYFEINAFCTHRLSQLEDMANLNGNTVCLAGIVSSKIDRVTKSGKPFGIFTIEDYSGSHEFALFSDDYAKYRGYIEQYSVIFIQGKVQGKFYDPNQLEFKVTQVSYLSDLKEKMLKKITLKIPLDYLTSERLGELEMLGAADNGKTKLYFEVYDKTEKQVVTLGSRNNFVEVDQQWIQQIQDMNLTYKVN